METPDRKVDKEETHPRVPIKTYKWEDVKRSRTKGGYPWTYLYKQPFDEELDPEPYTMEGMRKSRSSSTMGKSEVEISEVMETENHPHAGEPYEKSDDLQIITEPDDHSIKHSSSSLVIEECDSSNKEKQGPGIFFLESAESSDDISQYLDKEDRSSTGKRKEHESEMDITMEVDEKDDEPQTRKRKLSAESSYSRISQTKSAILKKIMDTKAKIKVPKLSFPTSKLKKPAPKKKGNSPPETKKEIKKTNSPPRNEKPLYIHIPLKPPPGETDEFSHMESGSDQAKKYQKKKPGSFRDLVKNIKQIKELESEEIKEETEADENINTELQDEEAHEDIDTELQDEEVHEDIDTELQDEEEAAEDMVDTDTEIKADNKTGVVTKTDANTIVSAKEEAETIKEKAGIETDIKVEAGPDAEIEIKKKSNDEVTTDVKVETDNMAEAHTMEKLNTEVATNDGKNDVKIEDDILEEVADHQTHQQNKAKSFREFDPVTFVAHETPEFESSVKPTESEEEENNVAKVENAKYNDMFDKLFEATTSKESETQTPDDRKGRSRSAEPERKRKISLESSYSRKSLSKLGFMKKLKEASDKIKRTLSRSTVKKEIKPTEEKIEKVTPKSKQLKPVKPIEPVYIHIPLKVPDEENEEISQLQVDEGFKTPDTDSTTPDSPAQTGVQFIFLTAPSDDETLDYNSSDVAETPSSENKLFFGNKITELKELAKGAVDEIAYPKHALDPVSEESSSDKVSVEGGNNLQEIKVKELPKDNDITKDLEVRDKGEIACIEETTSVQEHMEVQPGESATSRDSDKDYVLVDEEDGLSEPKATKNPKEKITNIATVSEAADKENLVRTTPENKAENSEAQSPELKSSLKADGSPVMKKKVSFKRRTKASKDGSYEDVQVISSDGDQRKELKFEPGVLENNQSKTVDEENSYLDDNIVKSVPPGEDYNKWSKISDHEYEPVNPPPENIEIIPTVKISENPTVCVINTDQILNNTQVFNFTEEEAYKQDPAFLLKFQKDSKLVHRPPTARKTNESPSEFQLGEQPYMQDPAFQVKFKKDSKMVHQSGSKSREGPGKFQQAIKQSADNFRTKLHNIKKPHITLPERPKFHKPNFSLPKIPDRAKINLPSFSLPQRHSAKRPTRERHLSTESNDGDSKKPIFDFSTYPRIFKKKPKNQVRVEEEIPSFATVPRTKKPDKPKTDDSRWSAGSDSMRVPLHSEDSMDADNNKERYIRGDSIDENEPSHIRYDEDIDSDDEYDRENRQLNRDRDFLRRWDQGTYNAEDHEYIENMRNKQPRITDLDLPEEAPVQGYQFPTNNGDRYSSGSSQGMHRQGVLEEINSDEFFLRQKGISQDNIEVGMYLSSEIREAFRTPANALSQMQGGNNYELRASNQSLPEMPAKRKSVKKPRRKKTPHTSQEKIPYDEESAEDELGTFPPPRPRRHSRRGNKQKNTDNLIPYQETIPVDVPADQRLTQHRESLGILADDEQDEDVIAYVDEKMEVKEPVDIRITDPYRNFEFADDEEDNMDESPAAPPRKQKSLKSLNMSESDSIMGDFSSNRAIFSSEKDIYEPEVEAIRAGSKIIIPIQTDLPKRPSRTVSRTNSQSRGTSQKDDESLSLNTESIASENQIPCVEEPCVKDLRDSMGYAIIDKSKARDPPLPPPRIPARRKRSFRSENDGQFSTVPRSSRNNNTPVRPLRNYSTLGQTRKSSHSNTYENKENIDISQYIEIEDEHNRDLQSGAVIKRMKDRPLPAPPRPPRKSRPFRDITSQENITAETTTELDKTNTEEAEVSTQTEPLPDDFICEEVVQEPTDTIIIPTRNRNKPLVLPDNILEQMVQASRPQRKAPKALPDDQLCEEQAKTTAERRSNQTDRFILREGLKEPTEEIMTPVIQEKPIIERRLITPSVYSYEETITHGSLLVQPLEGAKLLPDSDISNIKMIPVHVDSDLEETSSIPEEFNKLTDPPSETKSARPMESVVKPTESVVKPNEFDILKAHKLQVTDLDVDQLTVNKLLADKIIVSEIDSSSIQTNDISSKTGALRVGEITLPPEVITQIIESIKSSQVEETGKSDVQKKTPISDCSDVRLPNFDEPSTVKTHTLGNEFQEGENVDHSEVIIQPSTVPNENALPFTESTRLPKQLFPGELDVQESPSEDFSAQDNLPEGSNVHESLREGLQESFLRESPFEDLQMVESITEELSAQLYSPEDFNVEADPSESSDVQESPVGDSNVQASFRRDKNVQEYPYESSNVQASLPRDPNVQESERSNVQGNHSGDLNVQEDPVVSETPPKPPPRSSDSNSSHRKEASDAPPPHRPPRQSEKHRTCSSSNQEESLQEPDIDDVPPPRPPQPQLEYIPSQPPASFYALRAQKYVDTLGESIPTVPRRKRHAKSKQLCRTSSEESSVVNPPSRRFHRRSSDASIANLSGQLVRVCCAEVNSSLKRLITYILNNVARNEDGKQDLNVMVLIVVVLIAGLILLGYGDEKTVVHLHHWDYFSPPGNT